MQEWKVTPADAAAVARSISADVLVLLRASGLDLCLADDRSIAIDGVCT